MAPVKKKQDCLFFSESGDANLRPPGDHPYGESTRAFRQARQPSPQGGSRQGEATDQGPQQAPGHCAVAARESRTRAHQRHHDRRPAAHRGGPSSRFTRARVPRSRPHLPATGRRRVAPRARVAGTRGAAARPRRPADAHVRGIRRNVLRDRVLRWRHRADQRPLQVERARLRHRKRRHRHGRHDRRRRRFRQFRRAH